LVYLESFNADAYLLLNDEDVVVGKKITVVVRKKGPRRHMVSFWKE
jgi:hypothetical protein